MMKPAALNNSIEEYENPFKGISSESKCDHLFAAADEIKGRNKGLIKVERALSLEQLQLLTMDLTRP